ncbi:MAG: hypothetical protein ACKN9F_01290 [Methylomonas sp.]
MSKQELDKAKHCIRLERIDNPQFLKNNGLGNEIGFWIFDYPANHELIVRDYVNHLTEKLEKRGFNFRHVNLFKTLIALGGQ